MYTLLLLVPFKPKIPIMVMLLVCNIAMLTPMVIINRLYPLSAETLGITVLSGLIGAVLGVLTCLYLSGVRFCSRRRILQEKESDCSDANYIKHFEFNILYALSLVIMIPSFIYIIALLGLFKTPC